MADIKVKQSKKRTVKTINKAVVGTEKMKDRLVQTKDKTKETYQEETSNNGTEYAINEISKTASNLPNSIYRFNKYGKKNFENAVQNIQNVNQKIKTIKKKKHAQKLVKQMKNSTKTTKKGIKTANRAVKTTKQVEKTTVKVTKRAIQTAKATAKATVKAIKAGIKATITATKAIIAATKALIAFLVAGGWIAVVVIIVICLIALICSSIFGIFFSSEDDVGNKTMSTVIREINNEFTNKITDIQKNNEHDEYEIKSNRAEWKDILSIYTVLVSNGDDSTDVVTLDDNKINKLKTIFWEMNIITSKVETQEKEIETTDDKGNTKKEKVKRKILYIDIQNKSIEEMVQKYNFNAKQIEQLAELQKDEYNYMWSYVLYGSSTGSSDIVKVALAQVGNVGGQPYWSWYGFNSRVEWCACFVSWCANECGYIEVGIIPKFASVNVEGVPWFKTVGLWKNGGDSPKGGDIIFFDWEKDSVADHVGIVEKTENGRVYTIEGNSSGDMCKQKDYDINSSVILGYGTPAY